MRACRNELIDLSYRQRLHAATLTFDFDYTGLDGFHLGNAVQERFVAAGGMGKKLIQRLFCDGSQPHVKIVKTVDGGQHLVNGSIGAFGFLRSNRQHGRCWTTEPTNEASQASN